MSNDLRPNLITAKKSIINFAKGMIPVDILKDISLLLSPCCTVQSEIRSTGCGGECIYAATLSVSVTDLTLAGKEVTILITAPEYPQGAGIITVTLDSLGHWEGAVSTSFEGCNFSGDYTLTLTTQIISTSSAVIHSSAPQELLINNCD